MYEIEYCADANSLHRNVFVSIICNDYYIMRVRAKQINFIFHLAGAWNYQLALFTTKYFTISEPSIIYFILFKNVQSTYFEGLKLWSVRVMLRDLTAKRVLWTQVIWIYGLVLHLGGMIKLTALFKIDLLDLILMLY